MRAASKNEVKKEIVCEEVTKRPDCIRIGGFSEMMQKLELELLSFIDKNNLKVTHLSFSKKSGSLCFDMPGQKRWKRNPEDGGSSGWNWSSCDSGGGGISRRKRRERRAAQINNATTNSISIINIHKPTNRFIRLVYRKRFRKII